jgi:glycosyltransferase involved in cell wall biosynthesis
VLLVNDYGTPTGGAEILMLRLRTALRERGHDARLFTSDARVGGVAVEADHTCAGTLSGARTMLQAANPWARKELRRVIAEFRPDVVHVELFLTQLSPLILSALEEVPALYHAEWYRAVCPLGTKRLPDGSCCTSEWGVACLANGCVPRRDLLPLLVQRAVWRGNARVFDRVVACSNAVRDRLVEAGIGPVQVLWNGVPERPARPPLEGSPVIAFAGRLTPEKGVGTLVDAFASARARAPDLRLEIYGDGPERAGLEQRVAALGLADAVAFAGHLPTEALERRLDRAWVQVAPSLWQEPFGLVVAEAMMRGTAVIATRVGAHPEFVQDGCSGLLVTPGDARALAQALLLLADRSVAERLGAGGRHFALRHLSHDVFVDGVLKIYSQMLDAC